MKKLCYFLFAILTIIFLYGYYRDYRRFDFENYAYKTAKGIDVQYHDKAFLLDYYEAVEDLNTYVKAQWSANRIDVRVPEDDDEVTKAAVSVYNQKVARVKMYEDRLLQSTKLKKEGMSNADIRVLESEGISLKDKEVNEYREKMLSLFGNVSNTVKIGDRSAFVYEVQKLLKAKGYDVVVDGVFKDITSEAILAFETKNELFPDGKMDAFTLEKLLE